MDNPYTPLHPAQDARMFCGRAEELNEIGAFIRANQSVALVGPRGIGKSSLFLQLARAETADALGIGKENLLAAIDCQAPEASRQVEIFAGFCAALAAALEARSLEPDPALASGLVQPSRTGFEMAVRKLNQRGLRAVLVLDEFEQLASNPNVDLSFYNALRSAAGRLRLAFLTASARPLFDLTVPASSQQSLSSPFFNIFAQLFLGLLSEAEARRLIRAPVEAAGLSVSPQCEQFIVELAGGHPLALQTACFYAWDSPDDLHAIEQQTLEALAGHFQSEWENLSPAEQETLRHPAEAGLHAAGNPALQACLRDLARKCLLLKAGGSYRYPSRLWAEFISRR